MANKSASTDPITENQVQAAPDFLTPIQRKRLTLVHEYSQTDADDREILFQSAALCHVYFPRREPKQEKNAIWQQSSGNFHMMITPLPVYDRHAKEAKYLGLPFGPKARLVTAHINTTALSQKSRFIEINNNLTGFLKEMGLTDGGNQLEAVRNQIARLASCVVSVNYGNEVSSVQQNMPIVKGFDLFPSKNPNQLLLWNSYIELTGDYFDELQKHAVPLPKQHLAVISNNAMALDYYCFLAHRLHRIVEGKPQFLAWKTLKDQFGGGYEHMYHFKADFRKAWDLVRAVYPDAKIREDNNKGLYFQHSNPPISKKVFPVIKPQEESKKLH